ncbi:MAG: hypothetical protein D3923_02675 [Candidatus Electrothrix sp. AR3]|nr:hypothetical protein [Candidatus Electrothrix sp. AR3]
MRTSNAHFKKYFFTGNKNTNSASWINFPKNRFAPLEIINKSGKLDRVAAQALHSQTGVRKNHLVTFRFQRRKKGDSCNA